MIEYKNLNQKQKIHLLRDWRRRVIDLRSIIKDGYLPALIDNITQTRELIKSIIITSGATLAFSLNLFSSPSVVNINLLKISLVILIFVVGIGYFDLKLILERENNNLAKLTEDKNKKITTVREAIDKAIKSENIVDIDNAIFVWEKMGKDINNENYQETDNWLSKNIGDVMLYPFLTALVIIGISLVCK